MNAVYKWLARKLTDWENYRTQTQYDDSYIIKLFGFQFVNSYASLYYIAFFRDIYYPNGLFNMGPGYQDQCSNNNCMALLSIQVFTVLLISPLSALFSSLIWP